MATDGEIWRNLVNKRKKEAFRWAYERDAPVAPVQGVEEPPAPAPKEEPPNPLGKQGNQKNIANRLLAEGLSLPESVLKQPPTTEGLSPSPMQSGAMGGHQSRLLQKRKNNELGTFTF